MNWHALIDPVLSGRLCLTLLHSVWQVALLAAMVWCFDRLWRNRSVELQYVVHVGALGIALLALPVTYSLIDIAAKPEMHALAESATAEPAVDTSNPPVFPHSEKPEVITVPPAEPEWPVTSAERQHGMHRVPDPALSVASTAESSARWLQVAPWIIATYVVGVVLMLSRLVLGILSANRLGTHADRIKEGPLVETLRSLAKRWSMKVVPALARSEQVFVPTLAGLVRPVILLPVSAISGLSRNQLELILAHELAHIRRQDMWINLLQRIAEAVLFFNPALWYLTRRISTLREYCCDEMACRSHSDFVAESSLRYASALLRVAELAKPQLTTRSDLASLAASSRSPSEIRRRIARLLGESVREPLPISRGGWLTLFALIAVLFLGPTLWQTQADPPKDQANSKNANGDESAQKAKDEPDFKKNGTHPEFRLTVIGPDGKPVPNAAVELRTDPMITADHILQGQFVRPGRFGLFAKTDDKGRLTFARPIDPKRFNISIKQPGFGPYWAGWTSSNHDLSIPSDFTAELEAGWSAGGVVVDEAGQPVDGAVVSLSVEYKKRPGDTSQLGVGTRIVTDAKGEWRFDYVPASKSDVHVTVNHRDFGPLRQRVPRNGFGIELNAKPTAQLTLKKGLTIAGTVTDDAGQPIEGALVRTKFLNEIREAATDKQGNYRIVGCEPRMTRVVVSAEGRAIDMQEVRVEPEMKPVNFSMKPGGKVRIRVVDENGHGIPKARIFFQRWRGMIDYFEFDHVGQYTDENGVWEWNEAPLDEFKADICRPGGMQLSEQPLKAREKEYVFSPPRALVVSGSVTDSKTGQPIKKFRVTPGLRNSDPGIRMNWIPRDSFEAKEGNYSIRLTHAYPAHLVRIEADGYQVAISRDIKTDEGEVDVDFQLIPAKDIAASIVTAAGKPAANAEIALGVAGSQISIENGTIDKGSTYATLITADENGRFSMPARTEPFQVVVMHPSGFAHLKSTEGIPDQIKLTEWASVEGVFRVGKEPKPNVEISLYSGAIGSYGNDVPRIYTDFEATTGKDGLYRFERVFPGHVRVGRNIVLMVDDGAIEVTSSVRVSATLTAGKTTTLNLGNTGRPVVGRLIPPEGHSEKVFWNFALIKAQNAVKPPPAPTPPKDVENDPKKYQAWWNTWIQTPAGQTWKSARESYDKIMRESPYITATVDRRGYFRIDDVPEGDYVLDVRFTKNSPGRLTNQRFSVPPASADGHPEPVNLGTLTLEE